MQALCFSPDGRFLASSGKVLHSTCLHFLLYHSVHLQKTDDVYIFLGVDSVVLLWDIATGGLMAQMKGHTDTVYSLCFSRDGGVLASGQLQQLRNKPSNVITKKIKNSDEITQIIITQNVIM